ncbi:MAG: zinc-ribbon domain-containing protein [Alistipes sp.]|nr:zinc-ribbon domain-containing protein [Alistipes sp.]
MNRKDMQICDEVIASYLDGRATAEESRRIIESLHSDEELREILRISQLVDADLSLGADGEVVILPIAAKAAMGGVANCGCSPECEKYILKRHSIAVDDVDISEVGTSSGWQTESGTALHNIGRHLERLGLAVIRRYQCAVVDIVNALALGRDVIAVVDSGELMSVDALSDESLYEGEMCRCAKEYIEDIFIGEIPDHCVVVKSCDLKAQTITLYDPNRTDEELVSPLSHFVDAWQDSKCYLVVACKPDEYEYVPQPIDLSDVVLDKSLDELREAIAENAHEVWAFNRRSDGWSYGPHRDDTLKQTPCMVPYSQLPDSEKQYDRDMAMQTIKLMRKLGYDLVPRKVSVKLPHCTHCGATLSDKHRFCHRCGESVEK